MYAAIIIVIDHIGLINFSNALKSVGKACYQRYLICFLPPCDCKLIHLFQ